MSIAYPGDDYGNQIGEALFEDYAAAGQTPNSGMMIWAWRVAWDAAQGGLGVPQSIAKHRAEWRRILGLIASAPSGPFPPAPARDALGAVLIGFQGVMAHTTAYGDFPMCGPETTTLDDQDLDAYCRDILLAGFTHGEIAVSWMYDEPNFKMPVPGRDLTNNLPELCRRIERMIQNGLTGVAVFLAGDGRSQKQNPDGSWPYNDPRGHTYGHEWLMANFERIWRAIMNAGLARYCVAVPGYDGVFYGWDNHPGEGPDRMPERVRNFGTLARSIDPDIMLFIEHDMGHIPTGNGGGDWHIGGTMENYDGLMSEFAWPPTGDEAWQVIARCVRNYHRPPEEPAGDDPRPPFYLIDSVRGRRYYIAYEYGTFEWTRGEISMEQVEEQRRNLKSMGCEVVC